MPRRSKTRRLGRVEAIFLLREIVAEESGRAIVASRTGRSSSEYVSLHAAVNYRACYTHDGSLCTCVPVANVTGFGN
jgi:hypothetical protein